MWALAERLPQQENELMTIAQQPEQTGIKKGTPLDEQRGIEKGYNEGKLVLAHTILQNGIDRDTVMKMTYD